VCWWVVAVSGNWVSAGAIHLTSDLLRMIHNVYNMHTRNSRTRTKSPRAPENIISGGRGAGTKHQRARRT
jgi:hypothetical protein